jgi:predicted ATP-grasp superfamily ATP-dependent carboligase
MLKVNPEHERLNLPLPRHTPEPRGRHADRTSTPPSKLPPAILLGGGANALSVARRLSALGVVVYAINEDDAYVRYSRCCRWVPVPIAEDLEESWSRFLLSADSDHLQGAVLLACSDAAITIIATHREELAARYLLDDSCLDAQLTMLDKLTTYREARAAGVATPGFWLVQDRGEVLSLKDHLSFPVIVKPRLSHLFEERFGAKFVVAHDSDSLLRAFDRAYDAGIAMMIVELIPGPDDQLCSYFTYLDGDGEPLFHFTKRVIRRYPAGMGMACYHVTDWNPELIDLALRLCRQAGLRGLANVEFKRDPRDGRLKLIECNARFVASNDLVARSGFDLAAFVYHRIVGRPQPPLDSYTRGMRLWDPIRDFQCYLDLRKSGELSFGGWLRSVLHFQTLPYFRWTDPLPALMRLTKPLRTVLARGARRS